MNLKGKTHEKVDAVGDGRARANMSAGASDDLIVLALLLFGSTLVMLPWVPRIIKAWRSSRPNAPEALV